MLDAQAQTRLERYLSERPEIVAAFLFGSLARGEAGPRSDIDLGILLTREQAKRGLSRSRLLTDLMEVLRREDVEAVILNDASPLLLHRVLRDGHLLYSADDGAVAEFTIWAVQKYEDTRPLRELQAAQLRRQLAAARPPGEEPG